MATNYYGINLPCTYKSFQIYVTKESFNNIGQRYIQHDYPNSNLRYMEPLGVMPADFTLDLTFFGPLWQENFLFFKSLMEDPTPGTLVMPSVGVFSNMIAMPASGVHDFNDDGCIVISVQFTATIAEPSPTIIPATAEDIFDAANTALTNIQSSLSSILTPLLTLNNALVLGADIAGIIGTLTTAVGYSQILASYGTSLANAIGSPPKIAGFLFGSTGMLNYIYQNYSSPVAFNTFASLATIGNNLSNSFYEIQNRINMPLIPLQPGQTQVTTIPVFNNVTYEQVNRNNNRYALINSLRMWAILMMLEAATYKTYTTVQDVINTLSTINYLFNTIIEQDITNVLIPGMKIYMEQVQQNCYAYLNQLENTLPNTQIIYLSMPISGAQLAAELYLEYCKNERDLLYYKNLLFNLNPSQPRHLFSGQVTIVGVR